MGFFPRNFSPKDHLILAPLCSFSYLTAGQSQATLNHCPISFIMALYGAAEKGLSQLKLHNVSDKTDIYIFVQSHQGATKTSLITARSATRTLSWGDLLPQRASASFFFSKGM